jgi:hypothetical protein
MACYDYDQTTDDAPLESCRPDRRYAANGVSWWPRPALSEAQPPTVHGAVDTIIPAPYDHSIIFLASPVTHLPAEAYYQYNYRCVGVGVGVGVCGWVGEWVCWASTDALGGRGGRRLAGFVRL